MERPTRARRAATILAAAMTVAVVGAGLPAAANAAATSSTHAYRHGVVPTLGSATATPQAAAPQAAARLRTNNLHYGGGISGVGVTTGAPRVYLVFWGSQWGSASTNAQGYTTLSGDPSGMAPYYQAFIKGLGTNSELWSGVMTQYCEGVASGSTTCPATAAHVGYPAGGALAGLWVDTSAAAPSAATGHQLGVEAVNAAAHFGNTTAAANRNVQYMIISPTGTKPDGFNTPGGNFCAWHDYTGDSTLVGGAVSSPAGPLAFTNLPYVTDAGQSCGMNFVNAGSTGTLDGVSIVGGHEYAETITDQYPAGGWIDSSGEENADKCAWLSSGTGASQNLALATGTFAVQTTWANDLNSGAGGCEVSHPIVTSSTTSDFSIAASPATVSVTTGSTATAAISTAVTGGSAQTVSLSASGLPSGVSAAFNPASVTAGSSSTLTFSASAATGAGTYPVTVTGTGAAGPTHSVSISLTVKAPAANDFSISASPASLSVTQGSKTTSAIATAVTSGSAQTVSFAASGLPAGVTASFGPASVTAGAGSTLTLTAAAGATTGVATVTVTGTGTSQTHTTALSLTVNAPVTGPLVANGGFETGNLTGWTASGAAEAVVSPGHSGSYAARLGSTSATNGSSAIQQTITVPSSGGTLSFWYQPHCNDTIRHDQQQMEIRSTTGAILATELNVCDRSAVWKQISVSLAGFSGRQIVLWWGNFDNDQWFSPSYFLVDDVSVTTTAAGTHRSGRPASSHHTRATGR
jgi:hypothetical protein